MAFEQKAWYDKAFISVSPVGGNEYELRAKTTSLSISGGNFDIEGIETFGGKVTRVGTREDIEISFDGIPVSTQDYDWIFHGLNSNTSGWANGTGSIDSWTEKKFRVSVLWTNQSGVTGATQAITGTNEAYRQVYAEAYCTNVENSMDAGEHLTANLTFNLPVEDETGGSNYKLSAKDTTSGTLSAVPSYTTTTKYW